jgi:hypothetical protein
MIPALAAEGNAIGAFGPLRDNYLNPSARLAPLQGSPNPMRPAAMFTNLQQTTSNEQLFPPRLPTHISLIPLPRHRDKKAILK